MLSEDFNRACALLPEGVNWGDNLTPELALRIAGGALRPQADAGQWNGFTTDEKDHFVGSLVEHGTEFVAPLYAVVDNIEKALMEKNRAQADAQPAGWRDEAAALHAAWASETMPAAGTELGKRTATFIADCIARANTHPAPEAAQALSDEQREKVRDAVREALGDAYDCIRVWEAWHVGTMSQDDFVLVAEDSSRVAEIADAAIAAILTCASAATVAEPSEDVGRTGEAYAFKTPADLLRAKRNGTVFYLHDGDRAPVKVESIRPREHGVYVGGKGILPYWITLDGYGERPDIWLSAAQQQAEPSYADNTPQLHVGNSSFESWYADYKPAISASEKQISRDAYAAGMRDPLVIAKPVAQHPETKEGV